jgi:acetate kinase
MSVKDVEHVLYKESGLKGLSEISADMRALLASPSDSAREAVEYFVDRCAREVASLATALGGLDALVFTAGIGERSEVVRQKIVGRLAWLGLELDGAANHANAVRISSTNSKGHVLVVPTNEELCIAQSTAALV